jgi:precorrin-2 dehydrogenase/sirohydrochlorin ferrochelatase
MHTHPVFLRLEGRRCVVVGGDDAAGAKALACARAGAEVTVIAAEPVSSTTALASRGITLERRAYRAADLAGAFLAYASTRDPELIARLVEDAAREGVLLNVMDVPEACTFISPAVVERGDLKIAIGTGGASPGLAARLRRELEAHVGPEYVPFVSILAAVRQTLAGDPLRAAARGQVVGTLLTSELLELVRLGRRSEIDALLTHVAGAGCTLDRLGVALGIDT